MSIQFCHATVEFLYTDNNGNTDPTPRTTRVTFAATEAGIGETTTYGASWVAPMDNFNRKLGRARAQRRIGQSSFARSVQVFNDTFDDFWGSIFADAIANGPCRWTITDISFTPKSSTQVDATA